MKEYIVRLDHDADGSVHYVRQIDGQLVRCKDCKHSEMNEEIGFLMCHYRMCYHLVPEDGFCNFGEKSNETD